MRRLRRSRNGNVIDGKEADEAFMAAHFEHYQLAAYQPALDFGTRLTRVAFMDRLTDAEQIAIETAAESSAAIRVSLRRLTNATFIDLKDPRTQAALAEMEAATLLASGRADAILTAPVQAHEVPR